MKVMYFSLCSLLKMDHWSKTGQFNNHERCWPARRQQCEVTHEHCDTLTLQHFGWAKGELNLRSSVDLLISAPQLPSRCHKVATCKLPFVKPTTNIPATVYFDFCNFSGQHEPSLLNRQDFERAAHPCAHDKNKIRCTDFNAQLEMFSLCLAWKYKH